jgi:hypothetical protein
MVASDDGAQLARVLLSRVVIYQVPSLLELSQLGIVGCAARNDIAFAGKRLIVLARDATSLLHVVNTRAPRGPRLVGAVELHGAARILATAGRHVLVATPSATVVVDIDTLTYAALPMRDAVHAAARLAGERFLIARDGMLEEWDAEARAPTRRLKFRRGCDPKFVGGNSLRWWMIPRTEPDKIDVVSLARDQVWRYPLVEPVRRVSVHIHGDHVLAIGAETGMPFMIDLARRTEVVTRVGLPSVDDVTWIDSGRRFGFAPVGGALALQRPSVESRVQSVAPIAHTSVGSRFAGQRRSNV